MYWISVERIENWIADQNSGFALLGISDRKLKLASEIKPGDLIFMYVSSGHSCFAGVREVTSEVPKKSFSGPRYEEPYPYHIETRLVISLPKEKWIKIHSYIGKLSFLAKDKDWRQTMRGALRKLSEQDGKILMKSIQSAVR